MAKHSVQESYQLSVVSRQSNLSPRQVRNGFTLIELLVVIAIIAILAGILMPVFANARGKSYQSQCSSNLKQIVTAWLLYADDNDERVCPAYRFSSDWTQWYSWDFHMDYSSFPAKTALGFLGSYTKCGQINSCPSFHGTTWGVPYTGYAYNTSYIGGDPLNISPYPLEPCLLTSIKFSTDTVVFADAGFDKPVCATNYLRAPGDPLASAGTVHFRHYEKANVAYADGHVKAVSLDYQAAGQPHCGWLSADDSAYDLN